MKTTILIILLSIFATSCFSQDMCKCFNVLNYERPIEELQTKVQKCLKKDLKRNKSYYENIFSETESSIEFIKKIGAECEPFITFVVAHNLKDKNLTDNERLEIINKIAEYFSFPTEKGTLPKITTINIGEVGVLYNKQFNKLYKDSLFYTGTHYLSSHDSLIIMNLFERVLEIEMEALTKDNIAI